MKLCTTVIDTREPDRIATFNGFYFNGGQRWAVLMCGNRVRKVPAKFVQRVYAKARLKPEEAKKWTR